MGQQFSWDDYPDAPVQAASAESGSGKGKFDWDQFPDLQDAAPQSKMGILDKIDSYTGAPVRAAVSAAQNAKNLSDIPSDAGRAYVNQFGQNPSQTPTWKDIMARTGLSTESVLPAGAQQVAKSMIGSTPLGMVANTLAPNLAPAVTDQIVGASPAGIAGAAMDVAANPASYIPVGRIVGAGAKAAGKIAGGAADIGAKAANAIADVSPEAGPVRQAIAKAAGKVGEELTGAKKALVENYATKTDQINGLIKQYGENAADQAADLRKSWNDIVQGKRKAMNKEIASALNTPEASVSDISAKPLQQSLENSLNAAHPVTQTLDRKAIQANIDMLNQMVDKNGNISLKDLHAFKMKLMNEAQPIYDAAGNRIFPGGQFASMAAAKGGGTARQMLINEAPSSVSKAESVLQDLHGVENDMNANLLKPESTYHSILRAGTEPGGTDARVLSRLSEITGHDFLSDAKDFATSRFFQKAPMMPLGSNSLTRLALAGAAGSAAYGLSDDWKTAALIGAGAISPAAAKLAINTANGIGKFGSSVARAIPNAIYSAATSPVTRNIAEIGTKAALATPSLAYDRWAQKGLQNLGIQDQNFANKLLQDPKAEQLLIQASDFKPGSKAIANIRFQIQKGWGK